MGDDKEYRYRVLVRREGLTPLPGAAEWVSRLHAEGWRQAIASSAPRANLDAVVEALDLRRFFEVSVAAEDVTKGKPDPEVFLTAAARLGAPVGASIVVE
ncbi:MAG: HAD family hydrolase, partial [Bryobacteraceae bacterium]